MNAEVDRVDKPVTKPNLLKHPTSSQGREQSVHKLNWNEIKDGS